MINLTTQVGKTVNLYFTTNSGVTSFPDLVVFKDGVLVTGISITVHEIGITGVYSIVFNPVSSGAFAIYVRGDIRAYVTVVDRDVFSFLKNIEDEAIGSWVWDKVSGSLTMVRQDGTNLANFNVIDTSETSSRELD